MCAMNPCKCGWYGDPSGRCTLLASGDVDNYRSRISGPLLDRIDIVVEVPAVHFEDLRGTGGGGAVGVGQSSGSTPHETSRTGASVPADMPATPGWGRKSCADTAISDEECAELMKRRV